MWLSFWALCSIKVEFPHNFPQSLASLWVFAQDSVVTSPATYQSHPNQHSLFDLWVLTWCRVKMVPKFCTGREDQLWNEWSFLYWPPNGHNSTGWNLLNPYAESIRYPSLPVFHSWRCASAMQWHSCGRRLIYLWGRWLPVEYCLPITKDMNDSIPPSSDILLAWCSMCLL